MARGERMLATAAIALALGCGGSAKPPPRPAPLREGPVALGAGEVVEIDLVRGRAAVELATPAGAERFVVVIGSTRFDSGRVQYPYRVSLDRAAPTPHRQLAACSIAPRRPAAPPGEVAAASAVEPPSVGARRTFSFRAHGAAEPVPARVVAVGGASVVWADESSDHRAQLDASFVDDFLKDFERIILPRARVVFGHESDVDHDGRIALLFTPLTAFSAVAFFSGCDLRPASDCPGSNGAEVLYLTPPNAIQPPYNTPRAMKEILAHEIEHLIHYRNKVLNHRLREDPDAAYLLEGFGALAQDALGFQAGNLYVTAAGLEAIDDVSLADMLAPGADYDRARDGPLRGGAYLFSRWLYDRGGGDRVRNDGAIVDGGGPTFLRGLVGSGVPVASELARELGGSLAAVAMDFFTTLALSNRSAIGDALPRNPCFSYLPTESDPLTSRQRGADVFAKWHGMAMHGPTFQSVADSDGRLRSGGVEYVAVSAVRGAATLSLSIEADPAALPRVRVARLR